TSTGDSQERPAVGMDADGDFVVAWHSLGGQDGDDTGVFARRFNADGTPVAGEIPVNTTTSNSQNTPAVAMDANGNFVVAWSSFLQDGSSDAAITRRFDADGTPASGEIQLNTTTSNAQRLAAVAVDADGDFVVAWQSDGQDGDGEGVFARVFATGCLRTPGVCTELPKGSLSFKNSDKPGKDQFKYKASGADTTAVPELFGDPTAMTDNVLCIYNASGLVLELAADAAELNSKDKPAWKINSKGATRFSNSAGNADGVTKVQQKPGEKGKASWSAGKANLTIPELPLTDFPIAVQNQNTSGVCVETTFEESDFSKNDAEKVKAKTK
ncbi:MAG: hypothetical protein ACREU7_15470, partial [Burkholderiales bacterium]